MEGGMMTVGLELLLGLLLLLLLVVVVVIRFKGREEVGSLDRAEIREAYTACSSGDRAWKASATSLGSMVSTLV